MKKILSLIIITLGSLSAFAGRGDVSIKGTITNPLADSITIQYISYEDNWLDFKSNTVNARLDKDGRFLATFPVSHIYTDIQLQNGEQATELFVSPGDKLNMTVNAADFDATIEYKGIGTKADVANFSAKHMLASGFSSNFQVESQKLIAKEPDEYLVEIDKLLKKEHDFLVENSKGLPQSFIEFWDARYTYNKYLSMLMYAQMHEVMKAKSYDIGDIPAENFKVTKLVPEKFNDDLLHLDAYRNYIREFYIYKLMAEGVKSKQGQNEFIMDKMVELARKNMPVQSEQYVFANAIAMDMKNSPIARTQAKFNEFNNVYGNTEYTEFLEQQIENKRRLSPGSPAIDFIVVDEDGKDVKLSQLKGKVVYLDFWASWCGPCKMQFPHTKKVKEHFAGKDVAFVYVSIDEDAAAWEKAMKQYDLTGLHTRVEGWGDKLAKNYGVASIPAYFLIDKEGNFAIDNTPRPSQTEELIKAIEALL